MKVNIKRPQTQELIAWFRRPAAWLVLGGAVTSLVLVVALSVSYRYAKQQETASKLAVQQAAAKQALEQNATTKSKQSESQTSQAQATTPASNQASATTDTTKYATSSDPRSTAYSTTPPAANPASFSYQVTHAGQFAAGTKISYNATKGETMYYGGDLVLSQSSFTFMQNSSVASQPIHIATPDGQVANAPSKPWNDQGDYHINLVSTGMSYPGPSTSWDLKVNAAPDSPVGTYTLHIQTARSQGSNTWQYDGFITVTVIPYSM